MISFLQRTLTGSLFALIVLACIWLGPLTFLILMIAINILALKEFYTMCEAAENYPARIWGYFLSLFLLLAIAGIFEGKVDEEILIAGIPLIFFAYINELYRSKIGSIQNLGMLMLGWVYITGPLALLMLIAYKTGSYQFQWIILLFVLIWVNDTMAFLVGKMMGRTTLFQRISPNKTWEGSIGGIIFSILAGGIMAYFMEMTAWVNGGIVGGIVSLTGNFGDLLQSMFKREVELKDSGKILPGHGGVLDRFDAFLFSVPFVFTYLELMN